MPGNFWDEEEPGADLTMKLHRVAAKPSEEPGALVVMLETSRGTIEGVLHPVEGGTGAVICVGGAMGGFDGPADAIYARLSSLLGPSNVTVLRLSYREPNNF